MDESLLQLLRKHQAHPHEAQRLWQRLRRFIAIGLIAETSAFDALELACHSLYLQPKSPVTSTANPRPARPTFKERAEQAAELLVNLAGKQIPEPLLDQTTQLLLQLPLRTPAQPEARLLADAVNLDDFGIVGLLTQAVHLSPSQLADACDKREQYGYWDARLRDGFHFEPVRQLARHRIAAARQTAKLLADEIKETPT